MSQHPGRRVLSHHNEAPQTACRHDGGRELSASNISSGSHGNRGCESPWQHHAGRVARTPLLSSGALLSSALLLLMCSMSPMPPAAAARPPPAALLSRVPPPASVPPHSRDSPAPADAPAAGGIGGGGAGSPAFAPVSEDRMPPELDAMMEQESSSIVINNLTAALQWFSTPPLVDELGDTVLLHGVERVYGPDTITKCTEVNQVILKAANQALAALQIEFNSRYVVERFTTGGVPGFPEASRYSAFDLFFSVTIDKGVMLQAPLTAAIVQLATTYVEKQLAAAGLATGIMLLGAVFPNGINPNTFAPSAVFQSVLKVSSSQPTDLLPFEVEKQTLLLSVLNQLKAPDSPIGSINISSPPMLHQGFGSSEGRKLLAEPAMEPAVYIGIDMILVPAGPLPEQVFDGLLGDGRYKQILASSGLPVTLEWVNTTAIAFQPSNAGQGGFTVMVYPEPQHSSSLAVGAAVGIAVAAAVAVALISFAGFFAFRKRQHGRAAAKPAAPVLPLQTSAFAQSAGGPGKNRMDILWSLDSAADFDTDGTPVTHEVDKCSISVGLSQRDSGVNAVDASEIVVCKRPEDDSDWLLGRGSFGQVFKGLRHGKQEVVIKMLRRTREDRMWFDRLEKDIAALSAVSADPNVVQYFGTYLEDANTAMLVMEYCEGGNLRQAFARDNRNEFAWCERGRGIAMDIARGLQFLHSQGVMHRDLKASNILLSGDAAKISDVGLASIMTAADPTSWDQTVGSFCYAAPELILGVRCTESVDIYSFGVLLWEICTREMPIRGQLRDIQVPDEAPAGVSRLIDECLQPNPAKRPTAAALYERLKAIPAGPKGIGKQGSGPLARDIGRDNGQRFDRALASSLPHVKSPGLLDSESLLASLYSS